jgi:hypothetical protein
MYKASNLDPDVLSYDEAMRDMDHDKWIESATKEIRELEQHGAWDEVPVSDTQKNHSNQLGVSSQPRS